MKKLILALLLVGTSWGQTYYSTSKTTTTSGSTEVVTVQLGGGLVTARFIGVSIDCDATCTYTVERNGTPATSTSLAIKNINPGEASSRLTAWSASNAGVGSSIISRGKLSAGGGITIDLSKITMSGNDPAQNITVRSGSFSGVINIVIFHQEI